MLIAANWKMFKGPAETRAFLESFDPPEGVDVAWWHQQAMKGH